MAILASLLGILIVVPVAVTVATTARSQGDLLDVTNEAYLAEAGALAVIEDLVRGADGDPPSPYSYVPPVVNLGGKVPYTTVEALQESAAQTITTRRLINYGKSGNPTVLTGTLVVDPNQDETDDDDGPKFPSVFGVAGAGNLPVNPAETGTGFDPAGDPQKVEFTLVSELVDFDPALTGDVQLDLQAWEESAEVKVYAYEFDPANPLEGILPADPNVIQILDHGHKEKDEDHLHDAQHEDHLDDRPEFDAQKGEDPNIIHIAGDVFAIAYSGNGDDGFLKTVEVAANGQITNLGIDTLEFDTQQGETPNIIRISANIYAIVYSGSGDDGFLKTFGIADTGVITKPE